MSNWAGFSEEDLRQLRNNEASKPPRNSPNYGSTQLSDERQRNPVNSKPRPRHVVQPMKKPSGPPTEASDVPPAAMLSASKTSAVVENAPTVDKCSPKDSKPPGSNPFLSADEGSVSPQPTPQPTPTSPSTEPKTSVLLEESGGRDRDLSTLQQYQQQQKMMEELNKKKKQMLSDALAQRQKQATVEAHKLNAIKKELAVLDQMLTADVNVIRDKIEEATREYTDASKRYEQAEKEFVASKVNLHKKSDLKEQLTEHLYTIIHQNEIRKAKKLADLMEKLDLAAAKEEDNPSAITDIPSYALLGNLQTIGSGNLVQHPISPDSNKIPAAESQEPVTSPPVDSATAETEATATTECSKDVVDATETKSEEDLK